MTVPLLSLWLLFIYLIFFFFLNFWNDRKTFLSRTALFGFFLVAFEVTFGSSFAFSGSVTSENFYRDKITEERVVALSKFGNVKQNNFLGCPWCHHFLKSKTREPSKVSSSSGMRGDKCMSVNNFSAQQHVSSKNRHSYGGA